MYSLWVFPITYGTINIGTVLYLYRDFHLHLETSTDIFLPGFKVYVVGKDGVKTHKSYQTKNIVRGYIEGERSSL